MGLKSERSGNLSLQRVSILLSLIPSSSLPRVWCGVSTAGGGSPLQPLRGHAGHGHLQEIQRGGAGIAMNHAYAGWSTMLALIAVAAQYAVDTDCVSVPLWETSTTERGS